MESKMSDEFLIKELGTLLYNGSNRDDINAIAPKIQRDLKKSFKQVLGEVEEEIKEKTKEFLEKRNDQGETYVDGISTCIYLPDRERGNLKLTLYGGVDNSNNKVDECTLFDVAGITELFTLILTFKLADEGYFNLNDKVADLDPRFSGLEDFTINDLLLMTGEIQTDGRIRDAKDVKEANEKLESVHVTSNNRSTNKYTDLGAMVLAKVMEKVVSEKEGKTIEFDDIMCNYITDVMPNTRFNKNEIIVGGNFAGNGNKEGLVHDPKTRIIGGMSGAAGLFSTSEDLSILADDLFAVNYKGIEPLLSKQELIKIGTMTFPDSVQNNKGLLGVYQKNPDRASKWLAPLIYGDNTFTAQGFTGAATTYDFRNQIHNNFMINSIKDGAPKKPDGFIDEFKKYQYFIVEKTMELLVAKKFAELSNSRIEVEKTLHIK